MLTLEAGDHVAYAIIKAATASYANISLDMRGTSVNTEIQRERRFKMSQKLKTVPAVTKEAVIECAIELGIPVEAITHSVIKQVRKGLKLSSATGPEAIKEAIIWAFNS